MASSDWGVLGNAPNDADGRKPKLRILPSSVARMNTARTTPISGFNMAVQNIAKGSRSRTRENSLRRVAILTIPPIRAAEVIIANALISMKKIPAGTDLRLLVNENEEFVIAHLV